LLLVALAGCAPSSDATSTTRPLVPAKIVVEDLQGHEVDPFALDKDTKGVVFLFISTDCPISNRYAPTVARLWEEFHEKGIAFRLVYPHADLTIAEIQKHVKEYAYPCPALRDPKHLLVLKSQARVTPEAAVFNAKGELIYHGRIDDRYVDFGKERTEPTRHDLADTLKALLDGKPAPQRTVRAIGCYIPDLP